MFAEENEGGDALNRAIPLTRGDFIHISANDLVYGLGWAEHALSAFDIFPDLGQLSLFADVPTDAEAWEQKPAVLRLSKGKILYEASANVSGSSVLRAALFRERGLQVGTVEHGHLKFPADGKLSMDVKAAGFWCAWSDRYYVRNVGHEVAEFEADPLYYHDSYANKTWVGIEGWQQRVAMAKSLPKINRASIVLADRRADPHRGGEIAGKPARLWSRFDGVTPSVETIEFLYALTRLIKPTNVLETRTWLGLAACAIGRALVANGFGHLTTFESDPEARAMARKIIEDYGLEPPITLICAPALSSVVADGGFHLAVFDFSDPNAVADFILFKSNLSRHATVVFHGIENHSETIRAVAAENSINGAFLPVPGGIFLGTLASGA